ncbi:MAG: hypothetical protein GEV08_18395 [Acidimicrobiia bacterium]|nr:hypothetical protein [Acidimicrobiia bacterium]
MGEPVSGPRLVLTVATVLVVAAGCAADDAPTQPAAQTRYDAALAALCAAAADARDADVEAARRVFYDTAHQALHELAADAQRVDRPVAARLLEAKQAVEAGLDAPATADELAARLDELGVAAHAALTATGNEASRCQERS